MDFTRKQPKYGFSWSNINRIWWKWSQSSRKSGSLVHPGITNVAASHVTGRGNACWRRWNKCSYIKTQLFNRLGFQWYYKQLFERKYSNIYCFNKYDWPTAFPYISRWTDAPWSHWRREVMHFCPCCNIVSLSLGAPFALCCSLLSHEFSPGNSLFLHRYRMYIERDFRMSMKHFQASDDWEVLIFGKLLVWYKSGRTNWTPFLLIFMFMLILC